MYDIYYNLIIIVIIIVLFLAYILIGYFYNNYKENKENVYDNLRKTSRYINKTNNTLSSNITSSINKTDNVKTELGNRINGLATNLLNTDTRLLNTNSNVSNLDFKFINDSNNLTNLDTNLKNYFQYKDGATVINQKLFDYTFTTNTPNLSLDMITKITAISGMTVKTTDENTMRICDNDPSANCIEMNIINGNFNIYPSSIPNNNVNNISFFNKNKAGVLAKFDLVNSNIYLGGSDDNAALFIHESNVYVKNINFLKSGAKYSEIATNINYNKTLNNPSQTYNNYAYNTDDIINFNTLNTNYNAITINGIYTIIKSTDSTKPNNNTLIINFKSLSIIPNAKTITISIDELSNTSPLNQSLTTTSEYISPNATLNVKNITLTITKEIPKNTNVRLTFTDEKLGIPASYTEATITNTFITTVT